MWSFVCLVPQRVSTTLKSHDAQQGRCVYIGDDCDIPHHMGEKVFNAIYIYIYVPLNLIDVF